MIALFFPLSIINLILTFPITKYKEFICEKEKKNWFKLSLTLIKEIRLIVWLVWSYYHYSLSAKNKPNKNWQKEMNRIINNEIWILWRVKYVFNHSMLHYLFIFSAHHDFLFFFLCGDFNNSRFIKCKITKLKMRDHLLQICHFAMHSIERQRTKIKKSQNNMYCKRFRFYWTFFPLTHPCEYEQMSSKREKKRNSLEVRSI